MPKVTENVDVLRQGWIDAVSSIAPGVSGLRECLEEGLSEAQHSDALNEQTLLGAIDDAMLKTGDALPQDAGQTLVRRLQRSVYEYLLSLDAALPEEAAIWPEERLHDEGAVLYGAEEVAALRGDGHAVTQAAQPETDAVEVEPVGVPHTEPVEEHASPVDASTPEHFETPGFEPAAGAEATAATQPEAEPTAPAQAEPPVEAGEPEVAAPTPPAEVPAPEPAEGPIVESDDVAPAKAPRRFAIFGRTSSRQPHTPVGQKTASDEELALPTLSPSGRQTVGYRVHDAAEEPAEPVAEAPAGTPVVEATAQTAGTEFEVQSALPRPGDSFTPLAPNQGHAGEPFMAPREGFHIREDIAPLVISTPSDLGGAQAQHQARAASGPAPSAAVPEARPEESADPRGWHVRDDHAQPTSRRPASAESGAYQPDSDDTTFASDAVITARHKIEERLDKRRCDEAAALVQKLAQDPGGRAVAELGLDVGDRCRALGKSNSALSCYLAATRADPVFDQPLLRLADICIDDHDIDLAVAYLERVARFYRIGGDQHASLRILRKIATIAPYRDDILSMLVRVQSTGRFDD